MTTRSEDLINGRPVRGTIRRATLRSQRDMIERRLAYAILIFGGLGSLLAGAGGPAAVAGGTVSLTGVAAALVTQALLTWAQWAYDDRPIIAAPARAIDALLTTAGYGPLVVGGLAAWLAPALARAGWLVPVPGSSMTTPIVAAWLLLWMACIPIAWYPEHRLVRD